MNNKEVLETTIICQTCSIELQKDKAIVVKVPAPIGFFYYNHCWSCYGGIYHQAVEDGKRIKGMGILKPTSEINSEKELNKSLIELITNLTSHYSRSIKSLNKILFFYEKIHSIRNPNFNKENFQKLPEVLEINSILATENYYQILLKDYQGL